MISVILYGRNDSHGYNLHKRAALSLNCIAEVLDAPADEIIFVDYNTPDDFPTFPEAIRDTLTPRALAMLRVLRVRPAQHARFAGRTHLAALEPIARNVALRRSNPENRWVLSTNTDMIFVPEGGRSLSAIVAGLADGFYHLPRFELPEALWEGLDRREPAACIASAGDWGRRFHLDKVVLAADEAVRFDGPGDFQLALRAALVGIDGFDERMLVGWHVDSNIAIRLRLHHGGGAEDLSGALRGYHCDHTRQVTPSHRPGSRENSWETFVSGVRAAELPEQREAWGLAGEDVEEVALADAPQRLARALRAAIAAPQEAPPVFAYAPSSFDRVRYRAEEVVPFLLDALASLPPDSRLGWFAGRLDLLHALAAGWEALGMRGPILAAAEMPCLRGTGAAALPGPVRLVPAAEAIGQADVLGFDFGDPQDTATVGAVAGMLRKAVAAELRRIASGGPARRFLAINSTNNAAEHIVAQNIGAARAPIATWVRQGYVASSANGRIDLLPRLLVGPAGERTAGGIAVRRGAKGHVFFGPYIDLEPGRYLASCRFVPDGAQCLGGILLEVADAGRVLAARRIPLAGPLPRRLRLTLDLPAAAGDRPLRALELRAAVRGRMAGRFTEATIEPR